jgi:hypothetical protein
MPRVCGLCGSSGVSTFGVVLAMDAHPLLGHHARGEPKPEAEEVADDRVQIERAMRLRSMQKNRYRRYGDVREYESDDYVAPPGSGIRP